MSLVSSSSVPNNHILYFSKNELSKILNLYSKGVSRGDWKDYAIDFNKNNAFFYIYKHTLACPEWTLSKTIEKKRKKIFFKLLTNNSYRKFESLDSLITIFFRNNFKITN
tara:strand:- start:5713 stop:6042 length:330 start_codon:yes stop_codon:yes gene_type:complete